MHSSRGDRRWVDAGPARYLYNIIQIKHSVMLNMTSRLAIEVKKTYYMRPILREVRVVLSARRRRAGPASTLIYSSCDECAQAYRVFSEIAHA